MAVGAASDSESPAIRALGPLFKLTEVHIWDDNKFNNFEASSHHDALVEEPAGSCTTINTHSSIIKMTDDYCSVEDLELALQMEALGLPVSFSTTKEMRNMSSSGKGKGMRAKSRSTDKQIENRVPDVTKVGEWEYVSSKVIHDSSSMPVFCNTTEGQCEASNNDVEDEHNRKNVCSGGEDISVASAVHYGIDKNRVCGEMTNNVDGETKLIDSDSEKTAEILEHPKCLYAENFPANVLEDANSGHYQEGDLSNKQDEEKYSEISSGSCNIFSADGDAVDIKTFQPCVSSAETSLSCALSDQSDHGVQDYSDTRLCYEYGDWRVNWDSFYMRNYFYNVQTQESTWYPPDGLEKFAFPCPTFNLNERFTDAAEEFASVRIVCDAPQDLVSNGIQGTTNSLQGNDAEFIDQSSLEISMNSYHATGFTWSEADRHGANCGYENLDTHAYSKRDPDSVGLLHLSDVKDHTTDKWDASKHWDKQDKNATCHEWLNVPRSFGAPINNSLSATHNNKVDMDENGESQTSELDGHHEITTTGKKKRVKRLRSQFALQAVKGGLFKYWLQRYLLFSRFDDGIKMDEEGWFSVTPESIARHHASRCGNGIVIDCFTGVGGNAIQFAMKSSHVIAIDINPQKIEYAQHNASIYGVNDRIDFVVGDFFQMACQLKGDTLFLSPPWGGPDYAKFVTYDIRSMLKPHDGYHLFKIAKTVASKVVMFLPRNVDLNQLAELTLSLNPPWELEVEKNFLNGKFKAITAYFKCTAT
ncbi:uncharacterized protein LOC103713414 isoform X2 [Phoenix dactylifera]|uniref:Trimethylguanosine synthase n=2 Tax=Phoenix dactylifera TaxID=42345 RepID=A0A8B7CG09_PHODC|nr:uncharacterized protein LOC103713414 isoform X2 [Phoenix dactylifera]